MTAIQIRPVETRRDRRVFLTFPWRVYRDDPVWVPPILPDRARAIDPKQGAWFQHGTAECFIAWRGRHPLGIVTAAIDTHANPFRASPECVFGFFECVDNGAVASAIFDHLKAWAIRRDIHTLRGPFNLSYEDSYGVLIEGRDRPPALLCGHSPPYYQGFFERYGFKPARGDNLAYARDLWQHSPSLQHLTWLADRVRTRKGFVVRGADLNHWQDEIDRVHPLLNAALAHLPDHAPWPREAVESLVAPFLRIADPNLVLFAEIDQRTVGWFPGVPNLNESLKQVNGLRYPWNYAHLWWAMRQQPECLTIKSVLVDPDYWDTGVAVLLFAEMLKRARNKGYKWLDLSLTSADNPRTPALAERMGAKVYKRYRVYRLDF